MRIIHLRDRIKWFPITAAQVNFHVVFIYSTNIIHENILESPLTPLPPMEQASSSNLLPPIVHVLRSPGTYESRAFGGISPSARSNAGLLSASNLATMITTPVNSSSAQLTFLQPVRKSRVQHTTPTGINRAEPRCRRSLDATLVQFNSRPTVNSPFINTKR